jgi:ketosteroid isomerase-like protein
MSRRGYGAAVDNSASVAVRFNEMINSADLDRLGDLMSEDHSFIDASGRAVIGKRACLAVWRGFFAAFPSYRNVFDSVAVSGQVVTIAGRSSCAEKPDLHGPALWMAVVEDGRVSRWRVYQDTPDARYRLGLR